MAPGAGTGLSASGLYTNLQTGAKETMVYALRIVYTVIPTVYFFNQVDPKGPIIHFQLLFENYVLKRIRRLHRYPGATWGRPVLLKGSLHSLAAMAHSKSFL